MKRFKQFLLILAAVILLLAAGCGIYVSDYYRADADAADALVSNDGIIVEVYEDMAVFSPALPEAGFIFYPGGKVEFTAYAPLMEALAEQNILCVLVHMPGNLAVLDMDAADDIPAIFPQINEWYIGGHSLGGSMAASWAANNSQQIEGLVLLAAYSTSDLTGTDLSVLSLYGSQDQVMNREKYSQYLSNLPENFIEFCIPGGNHAFFGSYGIQDGDGEASITPQAQQAITVDSILSFFDA